MTRRALVVMGVTGSGKSTVGAGLATKLGVDFIDGDDLHPPANVAKMARGEPLDDNDRWPWLDSVAAVLIDDRRHPAGTVVACSALRRRYRDRIRTAAPGCGLFFVFLDLDQAVAVARLQARHGHFMPASLVASQFATLERPGPDETDVITIAQGLSFAETIDAAAVAARSAARG